MAQRPKNDKANVHRGKNMHTEMNYSGPKVNRNCLSNQIKFIMVNAGDGADRGEIFARYYGLARRYLGYYTDPCMHGKELREYQKLYCEKQPVFTKALRRLEAKGLVKLIKHGCYVKRIHLTHEGSLLAAQLSQTKIKPYKWKEDKKKSGSLLERCPPAQPTTPIARPVSHNSGGQSLIVNNKSGLQFL